ncbi:MAG: MBL fold metallo-hydrolase [Candidatus Bathyarchaeota archaeon]|nr:MBL fold metallo-hydrolase [Candidatus Bathyarchaeota archaeon]
MPLTVKWANGIAVEYNGTKIIFDPKTSNPAYQNIFITHAHQDHARGFEFQSGVKYSTRETHDLIKAIKNKQTSNWRPIVYGQSIRINDLEIEALNAGHVLGSAQYKVTSPDEVLVYTGDVNTINTLTNKTADITPCDILIIEATFGSPEFIFPSESETSTQAIKWALKTMQHHKIPTFQCDHIGNAQELIKVFNSLTTLPVVTHPKVTRINKVYESYGHKLSYLDAGSEEAKNLFSSKKCVFITPKNLNLQNNPNLEVALASGLALRLGFKRKCFLLSDHADFNHLLKYVMESKPKIMLSNHGGVLNETFAKYVRDQLKIEAHPLGPKPTMLIPKKGRARIKTCEKSVLMVMKMPGFNYPTSWLVEQIKPLGFSEAEIKEALRRLTGKGLLKSLRRVESYELKNSN